MKASSMIWLYALLAAPAIAEDQVPAAAPQLTEVALGYTYMRANAPPRECDCFSMNGGSISLAQPIKSGSFALAFDATIAHASSISTGRYDLTLETFTVGGRYRPLPNSKWSPFGQVLLGASHASGTLVEGATPAASDASLKFAAVVGAGIDVWLDTRWSLRALEVDYSPTTYSNRVNNHQNNLRLGVACAYHFGQIGSRN
jgi:outer membrane immunogenic protein